MLETMYSSFVSIATLVKSNLGERCLINIPMNIWSESLRYYLEYGKIYKGISSKKKIDLVEMIVYGCTTDKTNKLGLQDITKKETNQILHANKIRIKTLPGYGNMRLKRKEILACTNSEPLIKVHD